MTITVNPITGVIYVPKADTTLVQASPTEIRELDLNIFRLILRDIEEDIHMRPWPRTHDHNADVTVGGVTLADVLEILAPYTVTFENGQYAVNLVGANSNVGDRVNVNQVSVRSANSAGLVALTEIYNSTEATKRLVEGLRPHHTGTGNIWYWNPYAGSDSLDGKSPQFAVETFAKAHDLVVNNNHDIIIAMAGDPSGVTVVNDYITVTKNYLFIRGPGRDFAIKNTTEINQNAVSVSGRGVELSGMQVETSATNTKWVIHTTGDFTFLNNIWVSNSNNGVLFEDGEYGVIDNVKMHHNDGTGLCFQGTADHVDVTDCHIGSNGSHGVDIDLSGGHEVNFTGHSVIHKNGGYGINISATSEGVIVSGAVDNFNNVLGDINDNGISTYISNDIHATAMAEKVWNYPVDSMTASQVLNLIKYTDRYVFIDTEALVNGDGSAGSPFDNTPDAVDFAEANGLKKLVVYSDLTIDRNMKNFVIIGIGTPAIDCNGQNLSGSEFTHCNMQGSYSGVIIVQESVLANNFWLNGQFERCGLAGDLFCVDGATILLATCFSMVAGLGRPTVSMNAAGTCLLSVRGNRGGFTVKHCNQPTDKVTVGVAEGSLTFDASCSDGEMVARGMCLFVNDTTGASVTNETQSPIQAQEVHRAHFNKREHDTTAKTITIYAVDGVTPLHVFDAPYDDLREITPQ